MDIPVASTSSDLERTPLLARALARVALARWPASAFNSERTRTTTRAGYSAWRRDSLRRQLLDHFDPAPLRGADVLDFGCGRGELTEMLAAEFDVASAVGLDLNAQGIRDAEERSRQLAEPVRRRLRFVHATDPAAVPAPDASCDLICCFDVVEHIPDIAATCAEWRRVLRPGGRVWIWWSPWRGPYGHHVEALIPLPWIHLVLAPRTVFAACAALYDHPAYEPRLWDQDAVTQQRLPNPWRMKSTYEPFLNRLTQRGFAHACKRSGLTIARHAAYGFGGSWKSRLTRPLRHLPGVGECFVSYHIYELSR